MESLSLGKTFFVGGKIDRNPWDKIKIQGNKLSDTSVNLLKESDSIWAIYVQMIRMQITYRYGTHLILITHHWNVQLEFSKLWANSERKSNNYIFNDVTTIYFWWIKKLLKYFPCSFAIAWAFCSSIYSWDDTISCSKYFVRN